MNQLDPRLARLFQAAARAPRPPLDTPPFGFETRVLAHFPSTPRELPIFGRAFLVCSAVMMLTVVLSYQTWTSNSTPEATVADSAIELSLP